MPNYYGTNNSETIYSVISVGQPPVLMHYDIVYANGGNDVVYGSSLGDIDILYGGEGNDTLWGYYGNDQLFGENGDDSILGGDENDFLSGGNGKDQLNGGDGKDTLYGDAEDDYLTGGSNKDTFSYSSALDSLGAAGRDTITDFVPGTDKVDLSGVDADASIGGNQAFSMSQISYVGGIASIDIIGSTQDMQIAFTGAPVINWTDVIL